MTVLPVSSCLTRPYSFLFMLCLSHTVCCSCCALLSHTLCCPCCNPTLCCPCCVSLSFSVVVVFVLVLLAVVHVVSYSAPLLQLSVISYSVILCLVHVTSYSVLISVVCVLLSHTLCSSSCALLSHSLCCLCCVLGILSAVDVLCHYFGLLCVVHLVSLFSGEWGDGGHQEVQGQRRQTFIYEINFKYTANVDLCLLENFFTFTFLPGSPTFLRTPVCSEYQPSILSPLVSTLFLYYISVATLSPPE